MQTNNIHLFCLNGFNKRLVRKESINNTNLTTHFVAWLRRYLMSTILLHCMKFSLHAENINNQISKCLVDFCFNHVITKSSKIFQLVIISDIILSELIVSIRALNSGSFHPNQPKHKNNQQYYDHNHWSDPL